MFSIREPNHASGIQIDHSPGTFAFLNKIKWEKISEMLRGVVHVYRLIESLASMGHISIWKLICAISVCKTLTVGVHLSSTPAFVVLDPPLPIVLFSATYLNHKNNSDVSHFNTNIIPIWKPLDLNN